MAEHKISPDKGTLLRPLPELRDPEDLVTRGEVYSLLGAVHENQETLNSKFSEHDQQIEGLRVENVQLRDGQNNVTELIKVQVGGMAQMISRVDERTYRQEHASSFTMMVVFLMCTVILFGEIGWLGTVGVFVALIILWNVKDLSLVHRLFDGREARKHRHTKPK